MSFARPRHTPELSVSTAMQRHMDRQIEERCIEQQAQQLEAIKKSAAAKTHIDEGDWAASREWAKHHAAMHAAKLQQESAKLQQENQAVEASLLDVAARTQRELRRSVTERGLALLEAGGLKRQAEAARHTKNKRKLARIVKKAQPRTEVALPSEVLQGREALEKDKRNAHRAEQAHLVKANKAGAARLRDVVRGHVIADEASLATHAAAHDERRQEMEKLAAAKRSAEQRAAKSHAKQLAQLAATAKPKTLVALGDEHGAKLGELTQQSERKAKLRREEMRQHEAKLSALTATSTRKIELPSLDKSSDKGGARPAPAGSAERHADAATVIQAARRGSIGRSAADAARGALARRSALTMHSLDTMHGGSSKLAAKLQLVVAEASESGLSPRSRNSIGERTLERAQTWLASQSRLAQRRRAIKPTEQPLVDEAVDKALAAAAAAAA